MANPVTRSGGQVTTGAADNQSMRPWLSCAATSGAIALGLTLCLAGAPAGAVQQPSESTLVITAYDGTIGAFGGELIAEVTLKCDPTGGSHIDAEATCATLDGVNGDLDALPPLDQLCPVIYQPVTIEVGGSWRGSVVSFEREYGNLCVAGDQSAGVFRF